MCYTKTKVKPQNDINYGITTIDFRDLKHALEIAVGLATKEVQEELAEFKRDIEAHVNSNVSLVRAKLTSDDLAKKAKMLRDVMEVYRLIASVNKQPRTGRREVRVFGTSAEFSTLLYVQEDDNDESN